MIVRETGDVFLGTESARHTVEPVKLVRHKIIRIIMELGF
jgi:hypothetical protein